MKTTKTLLAITGLCLFTALLVIGLNYLFTASERVTLDLERENVQHSRQYIESKRSYMLSVAREIREIDVEIARYENFGDPEEYGDFLVKSARHRSSLLQILRNEATKIPKHEVPDEVRNLLK